MFKVITFLLLLTLTLCQSSQYDERIALKMINISAATYYTSDGGNGKECPRCYPGFQVEAIVQSKSLLAIVGYDPAINAVVIGFRGSDNALNWATDLRARHSLYSGKGCLACLVHAGFRDSLSILYKHELKKFIATSLQAHPNSAIIFTGHSLGGALANLASIRFFQDHPEHSAKVQIYTLGQPRVGDVRYAKYHSQKIVSNFRIVHARDLVPHQPPFLLAGTLYRHSGTEVWYELYMKNKKICQGDSNDCSNSVGSQVSDFTFDDHSSNHYLKLALDSELNPEL